MHWNGTAWKRVASPKLDATLYGVAAASSRNVWAVGATDRLRHRTVIEHWNGTAWRRVPSPNYGRFATLLFGVAVTSPTNAWAVGDTTSGRVIAYPTFIVHWNGTAWKRVPSPNAALPNTANHLSSVAASSRDSAWAVGDDTSDGIKYGTLILRWNGTKWQRMRSHGPGDLNAVAAGSPADVWAVGVRGNRALVVHCCRLAVAGT